MSDKYTVLVGKVTNIVIDVKEPTRPFPSLYAVWEMVNSCTTLVELFPNSKFFANYMNELSKLSRDDFHTALEQIADHLFEAGLEFNSDSEEEMWNDIDAEDFASVISTNFGSMYKQFLTEIGK